MGEGKELASSLSSADILSEAVRDVETERGKASVPSDVMGGASSLLPIVSSQRERFKQRNLELEAVSCIPPALLCSLSEVPKSLSQPVILSTTTLLPLNTMH